MARNDVYLNINALSPADAVVTGQQDMTAATVPELVLGDTPTFNFYFTDNTNVWPSWAGNASYTLTWALSDAVAGDFAPAATTGNATPITGGWSVILPLNSYDLVGLLNTKRVGQPYPVQNLWQQLRVTDPSGNEVTRAMFWTPVRYRAISDTQNTESASPTGGRFVTVNNVNALTTPTAAQFYAVNPVPTSALGSAANGELLIGNGTGFTKATLTAGTGVSITNGSGSITISATDGDITLDDGTAAAPSLKFTADTDTGIYRPSDNVVGISAGGVSRATFGATTAINGTTIPGSKTLVVTTDKLSALAATTSAELAGVISDETGTGALVFANTPTLVTPNIGAATGTSFNLTGSGTLGTTLTVNGTTDSSSKDTGAIITEGGLGVEKSANIGGNLTVSGGAVTLNNATESYVELKIAGTTKGYLDQLPSTLNVLGMSGVDVDIYAGGNNPANRVAKFAASGIATTLYGNLTVSGTGNSSVAGTLLVATTTNSANGRLQLATHTSSAGGIGLGTSLSIYRSGDNSAWVDALSGNVQLVLGRAGAANLAVLSDGSYVYASAAQAGMGLIFRTNGGTAALTITSAQQVQVNATTASTSTSSGALVVSGGVGVAGAVNVGGAISIGNTVQTAASVVSTHKVTISIGGVTYYLLATNV